MNYAQLLINVTHDMYGSIPCDPVGVDVILGVDIIWNIYNPKITLMRLSHNSILRQLNITT